MQGEKEPCSPTTRYDNLPAVVVEKHDDTNDVNPVLQTPRRGRRMAGVEMGWHSPRADEQQHTLAPTSVTPKKRSRSSVAGPSMPRSASTAQTGAARSALWDNQGYASVAIMDSATQGHLRSPSAISAVSSSPSFAAPPTAAARYDHLAAFRDPRPDEAGPSTYRPSTQSLVAVEVQGMGRVAVEPHVAVQLGALTEDEIKASLTASSEASNDSSNGLSSDSHHSVTSSATSLETPSCIDPSPSFSLASHFPASEDGSPSLRAQQMAAFTPKKHKQTHQQQHQQHRNSNTAVSHELLDRINSFKDRILATPVRPEPTMPIVCATAPRLGGSSRSGADSAAPRLPLLDWPDSPSGPWADASRHSKKSEDARINVVSSWLDVDDEQHFSDPESSSRPTRGAIHHHPMVAKVLRERARKDAALAAAAALAASTPKPKKRGRKTNAERERLRLEKLAQERRQARREQRMLKVGSSSPSSSSRRLHAATGTLTTPSNRHRPMVFGSAGALSDITSASSILDCSCGVQDDDVPMVRCDACHRWYHMQCAGVAPHEELGETWYCIGCEHEAASTSTAPASAFRRRSVLAPADLFSPSSAGAMAGALRRGRGPPSTGGSFTSSHLETPTLLSASHSLPAFPRTYGAHVGVETPSYRGRGAAAASGDSSSLIPVFTHPPSLGDSPSAFAAAGARSASGLPYSSALALAPSPQMDAAAEALAVSRPIAGRARASRTGWHAVEPSSPLDRKSSTAMAAPATTGRFRTPSYGGGGTRLSHSRGRAGKATGSARDGSGAISSSDNDGDADEDESRHVTFSPSIFTHASKSEWDLSSLHARRNSHWQGQHSSRHVARTPSPSRPSQQQQLSTPSRHARSTDGGAAGKAGDDALGCGRDSDDVFSTPSRHLPGSAFWGSRHPATLGGGPAASGSVGPTTPGSVLGTPRNSMQHHPSSGLVGLQTPSRSTRRRESSAWGLSLATTPSSVRGDRDRDLLFSSSGAGVDVTASGGAAGAPSLVFSSGSRAATPQHGEVAIVDFPHAHWNADSAASGSPTLAAARRRPSTMMTATAAASSPSRRKRGGEPGSNGGAAGPSMLGSQASTSSVRSATPQKSTNNTTAARGSAQRASAALTAATGAASPELNSSDFDDDLDDEDDADIPSSSPYPRTPSGDIVGTHYHRRGTGASSSGGGGGGAPTPGSPTPNRRGAKGAAAGGAMETRLAPGPSSSMVGKGRVAQTAAADGASNASPQRLRQVSAATAAMAAGDVAHFGLGLDLDEIIDFF